MQDCEFTHFHLFCGLGGGAKGFNRGRAELNGLRGRFRCIGGVDVSPAAIRDFNRLAGVQGTVLDMFDREQYLAFHGVEPPLEWREATPQDIQKAAGYEKPNIVFLSAPCKGFSGLLSESRSKTEKYQALNRLTLRGVWLMLEAWADDLPEFVLFENVPRIATRGRALLDRITTLLRHYGYAVSENFHDCGEIGGIHQSRKRFLLVARNVEKVPPFLYEPVKHNLRPVGELLEKLPLPGDIVAGGAMHSVPNLQWKTWVRLAFVEAGSDWRSLKKLRVVDGKLADYLLVPDYRGGYLGVNRWEEAIGTVQGRSTASNGAFSVADPRFSGRDNQQYGVIPWSKASGSIINVKSPGQGTFAVADPRGGYGAETHKNVYRIVRWDEASQTISSGHGPSSGGMSVADPRHFGPAKHSNEMRIVRYDEPARAVSSAHSTGACIVDPRVDQRRSGALGVRTWSEHAGAVAGESLPPNGAFCVADPRFANSQGEHGTKYAVQPWDAPSKTITGSDRIGSGALCIADPRVSFQRERGDNYLTAGHYGVVGWDQPCGAVSAAAGHDNGRWNVADPRLPESDEKLVAVIRSLDNTWHRPFTTLELAALQSLVDPDDLFDLDGTSDSAKRERIGNAVPPMAAQAIADLMCQTLLMVRSGQTFALSATPIWVQPLAIALSVDVPSFVS